jgi:hypothetical protein
MPVPSVTITMSVTPRHANLPPAAARRCRLPPETESLGQHPPDLEVGDVDQVAEA